MRKQPKNAIPVEASNAENVAVELGLADRGWYMFRPSCDQAVFELKRAKVSEMELVDTRIDRSIGRFDPRKQGSSYISMGFFAKGADTIEGPYGRIAIGEGDTLLWHSSVPMSFNVQEPIHLLNIVFCDKYLKSQILDIPAVAGIHFRQQDPFGAILNGFMRGLLSEWQSFSESDLVLALLVARSLMVKAVQKRRGENQESPDGKRMTRAMRLIDQGLYDPELSPKKVADALHMSLRSLYMLFSRSGLTVQGYIRDRRLEDCRQIIASKRIDLNMRQLALSRGFNDLSGFSRAFKRKFGMSPMDFQKWVSTPLRQP